MNFCSQLLKMSLITGFIEITKSKRFLRKTLKLSVHFICAAGFFYQTGAFLQLYLTYPTTQHTSEEYLEEFMAPGLTICNDNRLFRKLLCTTYPGNCDGENSTVEEFCKAHRLQCAFWADDHEFTRAFPSRFGSYKHNRSSTFLNTVAPREGGYFISHCEPSFTCRHRVIQAAKNGYPYNCFSLFSSLGNPSEDPFNVTCSDEYVIRLRMRPEEYIEDIDNAQAWVMLHDPRKKVNPMTEGLALTAGKKYYLFPNMEKSLRLPVPYSTQCMDYLKEWKKNGESGPLSKKDCIDQCKIDAMVEKNGCVGHDITYPNNYPICDDNAPASTELIQNCSSICREACEENMYPFTTETVGETLSEVPPDVFLKFMKNQRLNINVKFIRTIIKTSSHHPKFESIELFSYFGGYVGIWLGISLTSLYGILKMVYDTVYPFLKRQRNQKKTTSIEKFRY